MLKVRVSDLKSAGCDFTKFGKVKKNTLYVCFITRHGVARPNVDSISIVIQLRFIVKGLFSNLRKTSKKGGGHLENR